MTIKSNQILQLLLFTLFLIECTAAKAQFAAKPLFRDPVYDGAADPAVIFNKEENKWFMFYTNRRANAPSLDGVSWVHGTRIGIAESSDGGANWTYRDTCDIQYRLTDYTHWAPEVIEDKGLYHMFLSYVPGVFSDWNHDRYIIHLTSSDLLRWKFESKLSLSSDRCIDACVFRLPQGGWRMYYNNEREGKSMYYAENDDQVIGGHHDVVVNGDRAYIFYFTHPGRTPENKGKDTYEQRRSSIQVAELEYKDGIISCDRDKPVTISLKKTK